MANFLEHFLPLLRQLFIVFGIILGVVAIIAFVDSMRTPARFSPLDMEFMGIRFRFRRLLLGMLAAITGQVLLLLLMPVIIAGNVHISIMVFYLVFLSVAVGVFMFTLDQIIFLAGVAGVALSNFFKGKG